MDKHRIYELAKELNTTSKRLMEKLAEININVKNHMSLLSDDELNALYKHIGVIRHDDGKKEETEVKKSPPPVQQHAEVKKDVKSAPRIIRTTEIFIDSKNENMDVRTRGWNDNRGNDTRKDSKGSVKNNNTRRQDIVHVADANSGLRAGFIRDTRSEFRKNVKKSDLKVAGEGARVENKPEHREDASIEPKQVTVQNAIPDTGSQDKPEMKPEIKQVTKQEEKPAEAVGTKMDTKNEIRIQNEEMETKHEAAAIKAQPVKEENTVTPAEPVRETVEKPAASSKDEGNKEAAAAPFPRNDARKPAGERQNFSNRPTGREHSYGDNRRPDDRRPDDRRMDNRAPEARRPDDRRPEYRRPEDRRPEDRRPESRPPEARRPDDRRMDNRPPEARRPDNRISGDGAGHDNRPVYGNRNQFDRRNSGDRPQGGPAGNRPASNRPEGNRPAGNRPQGPYRPANKPLEIPKPELSLAQKEEAASQRSEARREFQNKDVNKDIKREQKRDIPKTQPLAGKGKKFKPQNIALNEKKGVSEILSEDFILDVFYDNDGVKRTRRTAKPRREAPLKYIPPKAVLTSIKIPEAITVKELSESLKKTSTEVIKKLMGMGLMVTLNQVIDYDTASIIADEFGVKAEKEIVINDEDILFDDTEGDEKDLEPRPPVVVVMGHVDHGKTSLLDVIREASVTESEAGGITQHIGAYTVKINNRNITFLDTPGHEAFTAMRARGAQVTDIAILVVAADDGVMPQTIEAINHAKAAELSIIVAINKIDKPGANPDKVKQELTEYGLVAEEWGGDAICVPVSAKKKQNIDRLLEMVLLTADMLELKANPNKQAKGTVIEAKLDKARGPIATVLVQRGTLNVGDSIVTGTTFGRIRAMVDDKSHSIKSAGPSTPVEVLGMPEVPEAGETFYAVTDEKVARHLAEKRKQKHREEQLKASSRVSLEDLFNQIKEGKVKELNLIVKADVQGSVEAVKQSLEKLSNDEVKVNIIHGGVGAVTESDVTLAQVSNAIIIGFNVRPGANVAEAAENASVDIRLYRVIYNAIEDIEAAMKGMLEPTFKEVVQGHAEIRQIFKVSGIGTIGGAYVTDGKVVRNSSVRVVRDGIVVHEGSLASLKRFKDDAREVAQGYECGLSIEKFNDIKEGDIVESYVMEEVQK